MASLAKDLLLQLLCLRTCADRILLYNSDYINPIDLCNRLNSYIIPEAAVHAFITFLFVINGYWLTIALNLPLLAYNAKKYVLPRTKPDVHTIWQPPSYTFTFRPLADLQTNQIFFFSQEYSKTNISSMPQKFSES